MYKYRVISVYDTESEREINKLGELDWELVSVIRTSYLIGFESCTYIFKKLIVRRK